MFFPESDYIKCSLFNILPRIRLCKVKTKPLPEAGLREFELPVPIGAGSAASFQLSSTSSLLFLLSAALSRASRQPSPVDHRLPVNSLVLPVIAVDILTSKQDFASYK